MKTAIFLFVGVLVTGCTSVGDRTLTTFTEQDDLHSVLRAVQELHGPPQYVGGLTEEVSSHLAHDFNDDGQDELVLFFGGQIRELTDLDGNVTHGFIMLTKIEGRIWPVFYYFNEYGAQLSYRTVLNVTGLVNEGGRDGVQTVWGWQKGTAAWPAQWTAFFRATDAQENALGPRRNMSRYLASYGK